MPTPARPPPHDEQLTDDQLLGAFPDSVGGIPFGAPQADVERICRDAGGNVIPTGRMRGFRTTTCSIAPVDPFPGFGTFTVAHFCEARGGLPFTCQVALEFAGMTDATAHFVLARLQERHGPARRSSGSVECYYPADREKAFRGTWLWPPAPGEEPVPRGMVIADWGCTSGNVGAPMTLAVFFKAAPMVALDMKSELARERNY